MLFEKLRAGLKRTRDALLGRLKGPPEDLEAALLAADVGVKATQFLMDRLKKRGGDPAQALEQEVLVILSGQHRAPNTQHPIPQHLTPNTQHPTKVIMIVGVNGSGKTTTVGKLANLYRQQGQTLLVAASDTYRDAAAPQLQIWADRAGVEVVFSERGQDAAAVAFDAIARAKSRNLDLVLVDTAGRLHTRKDLMEEVKKIKRVVAKALPGAPDEILLVLDATVGQNGIVQAKSFDAELGLTGLIITKLDGTAKGGVLIPIAMELNLPIRYIGVGEGLGDLEVFSAEDFARALFEEA